MNPEFSLFLLIASLFSQQLTAGANPSCGSLISYVTSETKTLNIAEKVLKRSLSKSQTQALTPLTEKSRHTISTDILAKENKNLMDAGFTLDEIDKLRVGGILSNSVVKQAVASPKTVEIVGHNSVPINSTTINEIKQGNPMTYYFADDGKLYLSSQPELRESSKEAILVMANNGGPRLLVKEAGRISYNPAKRNFELNPKVSVDLSTTETAELGNTIKAFGTVEGVPVRTLGEGISHSKLVNCLDVISAQYKGKNFILDKMISDNAVTMSALAATEITGANRLGSQNGEEIIAADMIGTNINSAVGAIIGRQIVLKNANLATSVATRGAVGLGMVEVQKNVYQKVLTEEAQERSEKIATFDRVHLGARLFVNHYFDQFLVQKLPTLLFNACRKNSKAQLFISPRAVRIYERYGSAMLYYGLRQSIVNE